jgi:hypothetical protein
VVLDCLARGDRRDSLVVAYGGHVADRANFARIIRPACASRAAVTRSASLAIEGALHRLTQRERSGSLAVFEPEASRLVERRELLDETVMLGAMRRRDGSRDALARALGGSRASARVASASASPIDRVCPRIQRKRASSPSKRIAATASPRARAACSSPSACGNSASKRCSATSGQASAGAGAGLLPAPRADRASPFKIAQRGTRRGSHGRPSSMRLHAPGDLGRLGIRSEADCTPLRDAVRTSPQRIRPANAVPRARRLGRLIPATGRVAEISLDRSADHHRSRQDSTHTSSSGCLFSHRFHALWCRIAVAVRRASSSPVVSLSENHLWVVSGE